MPATETVPHRSPKRFPKNPTNTGSVPHGSPKRFPTLEMVPTSPPYGGRGTRTGNQRKHMKKQELTTHTCGAHVITALDSHRAAIPVTLEPYPLNNQGEAAALQQGRSTYQPRHYGQGKRRAHHIKQNPAETVTVLTSHQCNEPIPHDWIKPQAWKTKPTTTNEVLF